MTYADFLQSKIVSEAFDYLLNEWDSSLGDGPLAPNEPCESGRALGAEMARLMTPQRERIMAENPGCRDMCHDCAFRAGSIPNGCLATVADALKCTLTSEEFNCHHGTDRICAGYLFAMNQVPESTQRDLVSQMESA